MHGVNKVFLVAACLLLLVGVQLGALGAHALTDRLTPTQIDNWQLAVQYQLVHALGLIAVVSLRDRLGSTGLLQWAGWIMLAGVVLFCGSIYASALGMPGIGRLAPFGGISFMLAWLLVGVAALRG